MFTGDCDRQYCVTPRVNMAPDFLRLAVFTVLSSFIFVSGFVHADDAVTRERAASEERLYPADGVPAADFESRQSAKADLMEQRTVKEALVTGKDEASRSALAAPAFGDASFISPSWEAEIKLFYDKYDDENSFTPDEQSAAHFAATPQIAAVGDVLAAKNFLEAMSKYYVWLSGKVIEFTNKPDEMVERIDPEKLSEGIRERLDKLSEVEGVNVAIPGADFVASIESPSPPFEEAQSDISEKLFTIDDIVLEKTAKGEFVSRVPASAAADLERKKLCFSYERDSYGNTVSSRLESGCVETLAKVLVRWAKYSELGFDFDKKTEEKVAKAVIRTVGVGIDDAFVKLEEKGLSSGLLEEEIRKISGGDEDTMLRVASFIRPASGRSSGKDTSSRDR